MLPGFHVNNTGVLGIVAEPEHLVLPQPQAIEFSPSSPTQLWVGRKNLLTGTYLQVLLKVSQFSEVYTWILTFC